MRSAAVVVGNAFGDEGKGTVTDHLSRRCPAGSVTVCRFNGGSQAAHNVVCDDGRHHVFAQYGAGSLAGAATHLSRFMLVNPPSMEQERQALAGVGGNTRVSVDPRALVITPIHRAANQLRELARGDHPHGSCGQGIGETVRHSIDHPEDTLRVGDLLRAPSATRDLLRRVEKLVADDLDLDDPAVVHGSDLWDWVHMNEARLDWFVDGFYRWAETISIARDEEVLGRADHVIFEGAQGVLLDERHGFAPHTTWSNTTSGNAHTLMREAGFDGPTRTIGVTRTYTTRHGAGPLPTETDELAIPEAHNEAGEFQGGWRQGWLDLDLLRYTLIADPRINEIAVTHLDAYDRYGRDRWLVNDDGVLRDWANTDDPHRVTAFTARLESELDRPIRITSWGPTASQKAERR